MKTTTRLNLIVAMATLLAAASAQAFFDPHIGRFASRDPIGERGGRNHYAFVRNDPVNSYDRLGLLTISVVNLGPSPSMPQGAPALLNCGGFVVPWQFQLDAPAAAGGGLIVQKVTFRRQYAKCDLTSQAGQEVRYEGWTVNQGSTTPLMQSQNIYDVFATPSKPKTFGTMVIEAEAKYYDFSQYPDVTFNWPAGIDPATGILSTTGTQPPNWNDLWNKAPKEGPATHKVVSHWNCCCSPAQDNFYEINQCSHGQ